MLVTAADALSAARPGARREVLETYVKRLREARGDRAPASRACRRRFAIQAGREIRIIVDCNKITDEEALWLSKDVAKKIEQELTYPGQIKVTVIREIAGGGVREVTAASSKCSLASGAGAVLQPARRQRARVGGEAQ